ncbi:hypothetical protein BKA01_004340 [Pseudonocardia eucalypti]|nr:hypothetical protein [Pseudonocardia eucalypti]
MAAISRASERPRVMVIMDSNAAQLRVRAGRFGLPVRRGLGTEDGLDGSAVIALARLPSRPPAVVRGVTGVGRVRPARFIEVDTSLVFSRSNQNGVALDEVQPWNCPRGLGGWQRCATKGATHQPLAVRTGATRAVRLTGVSETCVSTIAGTATGRTRPPRTARAVQAIFQPAPAPKREHRPHVPPARSRQTWQCGPAPGPASSEWPQARARPVGRAGRSTGRRAVLSSRVVLGRSIDRGAGAPGGQRARFTRRHMRSSIES